MDGVGRYVSDLQAYLGRMPLDDVREVIAVLHHARMHRKQVFIMGNGGSAATASHFANDLNKGAASPEMPLFRAIALTDNMSLFSAYANDLGYEHAFASQLSNLLEQRDVVIAFSGSGKSPNVLRALDEAHTRQAVTIGFTGFDGGELKDRVDICILAPSHCMEHVEDMHLILEHLICSCLRNAADVGSYQVPQRLAIDVGG